MEIDIEVLEEFAKTTILYGGRIGLTNSQFEEIRQAIENLINRVKELEEENNKFKNASCLESFKLGKESSRKRIEYDYISKDQIRKYIKTLEDKLKEYKVNMGGKEYIVRSYLDKKEKELVNNIIVQIATLKELL